MDHLRSELINTIITTGSSSATTDSTILSAENVIDKQNVQSLLDNYKNLNRNEQLYFLLQIGNCNRPSTVDLTKTIQWLRSNFLEDNQVAIPKEDVYSLYLNYTMNFGIKAVSTADFGKIVRQVFPEVKARRLGQRGNSKYCYANIRRKLIPDEPTLPTIPAAISNDQENNEAKILQWGSKIFGIPLTSLSDFIYVMNSNLAASPWQQQIKAGTSGGRSEQHSTRSSNNSTPTSTNQMPPTTLLPSLLQQQPNHNSHSHQQPSMMTIRSDSIDDPELTTYLEDDTPSLRSLLTNKFIPVNAQQQQQQQKRRHASAFPTTTLTNYTTIYERSQSVPVCTADEQWLLDSTSSRRLSPRNPMLSEGSFSDSSGLLLEDDMMIELVRPTDDDDADHGGIGRSIGTSSVTTTTTATTEVVVPIPTGGGGGGIGGISSMVSTANTTGPQTTTTTTDDCGELFSGLDLVLQENIFQLN